MDVTMPHLAAEQMRWRVQLCHHGSIGVTEVVIFEIHPQPAFDFSGGVLEGIDRLNPPVRQTIHQCGGGDCLPVDVFNHSLVLLAEAGKILFIFCPPLCFFPQMVPHGFTELDGSLGIARLGRNQLDKALLVLHLPVDGDGSILQIDILPFQAKAFIRKLQ